MLTTNSLNLPFIDETDNSQVVSDQPAATAARRPPNAKPPPGADPRHRARTRVREQVDNEKIYRWLMVGERETDRQT